MVVVEPWGMPFELAPSEALRVRFAVTLGASIEIESEANQETLWAPPGSTVRVYKSDELIYSSDVPVPDVPDGSSTREFLQTVFGNA